MVVAGRRGDAAHWAGHARHSASTKSSVTLPLLAHAEQNWTQFTSVEVAYCGAFAYVTAVVSDSEQIPLCRLRYGGSAQSFGFAIYTAAHDRYQEAGLLTALGAGRHKTPSTPPAPSTSPTSTGARAGLTTGH